MTTFQHFPVSSNQLFGMTDSKLGPTRPVKTITIANISRTTTLQNMIHFRICCLSHGWTYLMNIKETKDYCSEAEIYAMDEAVKHIIHLQNIRQDLNFKETGPIAILNDNHACVLWSKKITTKWLKHI